MIDPLLGACVEACSSWILLYARLAYTITDVPDEISVHFPLAADPDNHTFTGLGIHISRRRRWLNGLFFAAVHSMTHSLVQLLWVSFLI